jgi:hypothetical protein
MIVETFFLVEDLHVYNVFFFQDHLAELDTRRFMVINPAGGRGRRNVSAGIHTFDMSNEIPARLREQARWQAGVITREQALVSGLSRGAITSKLEHGRWVQVYRGIYATFTGSMNREAQLWAGVLYAGPGARLSHETAAELIRLTDRRAPVIHVTISSRRRVVPPAGLIIHRSISPHANWRFARGVPPHTLAEETVIDLVHAATGLDDVIACVTGAFARRLTDEERLRREAAARRKLRWRAELDEIIRAGAGGANSVIEYRYDRDVERAHGLPPAARQAGFAKPDGTRGYRDRYYEEYGLIIELDGKQYHPDERKGRDQDRDNDATATVGATLRYGWIDVTRKPCASAAQVHAALTRRGYTGPLKPCSPTCGILLAA